MGAAGLDALGDAVDGDVEAAFGDVDDCTCGWLWMAPTPPLTNVNTTSISSGRLRITRRVEPSSGVTLPSLGWAKTVAVIWNLWDVAGRPDRP